MEKESFCVTNKNMELEYLSEEYQKLKRLGDSLQKETWLVSEKGTGKLYVWKEVPREQREIYEKIKRMAHPNFAKIKAIIPLIVPLIVQSIKKSESLADAITMRCFK